MGTRARVHWAEERRPSSQLTAENNSGHNNEHETVAAIVPEATAESPDQGLDCQWDDEEEYTDKDDEEDSEGGEKAGERRLSGSSNTTSNFGGAENISLWEHIEEQDDDEEVDSGTIVKLRDELALLNAKVKGLEDELEDELDGSEDQTSTQV